MSEIWLKEIPYQQDSSQLFAKIRHLPWAVYLDSCQPQSVQGRYDIMTACPHTTIVTHGDVSTIATSEVIEQSYEDPFALLQKLLNRKDVNSTKPALPFYGGAIGYFAYDLARRLEKIPTQAKITFSIPDLALGIYDWALVIDHHLKSAYLVSLNLQANTATLLEQILECLSKATPNNENHFQLMTPLKANMTQEQYGTAFHKIIDYIHQGDCYQVNLAQQFSARYQGAPWIAYQQLRQKNPAPYAAYLQFPESIIMSLSPERFLLSQQNKVTSKPMKGTRPRGATAILDHQYANELQQSPKDRAENVMIVDLIRHDLSKVCRTGSVHVPTLFDIETFPAVHQMVSTVIGELNEDKNVIDLLRACFPGGSITGTPKIRAMEIIEELEPERRAIYCGTIGYISHHQQMDMNIAIRTLLCHKNRLVLAAGGALVADSQQIAEYQETLDKIALIRQVLEAKYCYN